MGNVKILAVDDETGVLKVIKKIFYEYDVTIETNSLKAVERLKQEKFDIFIVDYQLPNLDGIEILEEIKEIYKNIPYVGIFTTPYGTIHLFKEEIMQNLFSFYLEKPFEIDDLKYIINKSIAQLQNLRADRRQMNIWN
jgi:DNA-binding NtrC family response regulator